MNDVLLEIARLSPTIALLIVAVMWLVSQNKSKDQKLDKNNSINENLVKSINEMIEKTLDRLDKEKNQSRLDAIDKAKIHREDMQRWASLFEKMSQTLDNFQERTIQGFELLKEEILNTRTEISEAKDIAKDIDTEKGMDHFKHESRTEENYKNLSRQANEIKEDTENLLQDTREIKGLIPGLIKKNT